MLILETASLGPLHGYGILLRTQQISKDCLSSRHWFAPAKIGLNNEKQESYTSVRYTQPRRLCFGCPGKECTIANSAPKWKRRCLYDEELTIMNDADIRVATKQALFLQHKGDAETVIFEELGVQHGASRIDLAVVNGEMHGFELKSDRDTLTRLPEQVDAYSRVFDRLTLVVGEHHVRKAVDMVPDWWGIRVARSRRGKLDFCDLRIALGNPLTESGCVAMLLWRDEALEFLEELGEAKGLRSKCKKEIYDALVDSVDFDRLRDRVRTCLRRRLDWRSASTRLSCGG